MRFRFREARPVRLRWIGPSDNAPPLRLPVIGEVAAVIGPQGHPGPAGKDGKDGVATIPTLLDGGHF